MTDRQEQPLLDPQQHVSSDNIADKMRGIVTRLDAEDCPTPYHIALKEYLSSKEDAQREADIKKASAILSNPKRCHMTFRPSYLRGPKDTGAALFIKAYEEETAPKTKTATQKLEEIQEKEKASAGRERKSCAWRGLALGVMGVAMAGLGVAAAVSTFGAGAPLAAIMLAESAVMLGMSANFFKDYRAAKKIEKSGLPDIPEQQAQDVLTARQEFSANHISKTGRDVSLSQAYDFYHADENGRQQMVTDAKVKEKESSWFGWLTRTSVDLKQCAPAR